jgi:hypothetical protein
MGPSQRQLELLSPEDRILYKKWLRRGLLVYSSLLAAVVLAAFANHLVISPSSDIAGDPIQTAANTAGK